MNTGEIIKKRRKELNLTADQVADEIGVSRSTIFRYENGDIEKIPSNMLEPLSKVLKTTTSYLMGNDEYTPFGVAKMIVEDYDTIKTEFTNKIVNNMAIITSNNMTEQEKTYFFRVVKKYADIHGYRSIKEVFKIIVNNHFNQLIDSFESNYHFGSFREIRVIPYEDVATPVMISSVLNSKNFKELFYKFHCQQLIKELEKMAMTDIELIRYIYSYKIKNLRDDIISSTIEIDQVTYNDLILDGSLLEEELQDRLPKAIDINSFNNILKKIDHLNDFIDNL